jgi:hypothetical protein
MQPQSPPEEIMRGLFPNWSLKNRKREKARNARSPGDEWAPEL